MPFYRRPKHLSDKGARFIGAFEGLRLEPYNDPAGLATIGYGHLIHHGPLTASDRRHWGKLTQMAALRLLQADAEKASFAVHKLVKAKINQAQHDALVSFAFNVGVGALETSTLLRKLNDYPGTPLGVIGRKAKAEVRSELMRWDRAGSTVLAGLKRRREAEGRLFSTGRYS